MVKTKFALFQVQIKGPFADAAKLAQAALGDRPKVLNTIDVALAADELILAVMHSMVLLITEVYKPVIGLETIGIDN